ncbi:nuclear transport factor 2 family protein [Rhizobium leguminosarum]|uniref:nuclear transport factor 2 family protein n=1 Tax=Rhizobium leguminosarum TaxID=384 RepID=UPI001FEEE73D|nr:nuclear transport factor 2 family protein [Rhizobium leguminosarum]
MQKIVESFIATVNAFDVGGALSLFAPDAVIDDVSVGYAFVGRDGVRRYLEQFFVGYSTKSRLLSIEELEISRRMFGSISQAISATRSVF